MGDSMSAGRRSRRLALAALFAVLIFFSKMFLPTPLDKVLVVVQALFLALGSIALPPFGATIVSATGGLLTAAWRAPLAAFTLGFAVIYGLLMDALFLLLKVKAQNGHVRTRRLVAATATATAITGMASYYTTVHVLALLPRNPALEAAILILGVVNGIVAGYLAALLWRKAVRHLLT